MMEITARELEKRYRNGTLALDALSLAWRTGAVHGLLGPNGAGKSTFLRLCATLDVPTGGVLTVGARMCRIGQRPGTFGACWDICPRISDSTTI